VTTVVDKQSPAAIFKPVLVLISGRSIGFLAAFAIPIVLARAFNQEDFGTYKQLFLVYGTLFGIMQLGMAESLYYFLPSRQREAGHYIVNALGVLGLCGGLCLVLTLQQETIAALLNNPGLMGKLPYIGVTLMFMLMAVVLEIVMTVRRQHLAASFAYGLTDVGRAVAYVVPVLMFGTLESMLAGAVMFAVARLAVTGWYLRREYRGQLRPDRVALRSHLGYAIPFGLAGLIEVAQLNFHMYAVSWYFDTVTFAIYAVGCLQVPLTDILMTSTCNVMMVNMQETLRSGKPRDLLPIWLDSVRKLGLIICPLVGTLLVVGHELIVMLFTEAYERSVPVFMVWSLSMLLVVILSDGVLRVFAQNRFLVFQNLIRVAIIAVSISWFLQTFNIVGAVMVTILATSVAKIIALARIKVLMEARAAELLPWGSLARTLVLAGAAGLLAYCLKTGLSSFAPAMPGPLVLVIVAAVYVLSYLVLLLGFGPMQRSEKRMLVDFTLTPFTRLASQWK